MKRIKTPNKGKYHEPYNRLKIFFRDNHITYKTVADDIGITPTAVSNKINGQSDFLVTEVKVLKKNHNGLTDDFFS